MENLAICFHGAAYDVYLFFVLLYRGLRAASEKKDRRKKPYSDVLLCLRDTQLPALGLGLFIHVLRIARNKTTRFYSLAAHTHTHTHTYTSYFSWERNIVI